MKLKNKVAIVTGGSKGIGEGIVRMFCSEGAKVVIADIDKPAAEKLSVELSETNAEVSVIQMDVSSRNDIDHLFSETINKFGSVDIVVNNAGIFPFVTTDKMSDEDWDKVICTNLKSIFMMSQKAAEVLPDGGRIINISSIASLIGFPGLTHYCASKAGINGYTRALALELAPKNITVNAVAPGAINTPGAQTSNMSEEARKQMIAGIPLGRQGQPEDIAGAVTFLASKNASYITGQVLVVDGGWTAQ